jgi:hypothetical protein
MIRRKTFLAAALLLSMPAAVWAYVVCTEVVNVYPDGHTTYCKDCFIYNNQNQETGEITNCDVGDPQPGKGPV